MDAPSGSPHRSQSSTSPFELTLPSGGAVAGTTVHVALSSPSRLPFKCDPHCGDGSEKRGQHVHHAHGPRSVSEGTSLTFLHARCRGFLIIASSGEFTAPPDVGQFISCPVPSSQNVPGGGAPAVAAERSSSYAVGHSNSNAKTSVSVHAPPPARWPPPHTTVQQRKRTLSSHVLHGFRLLRRLSLPPLTSPRLPILSY